MKDRFDIDKLFGPPRGGLLGWITRANNQCISMSRVEAERCYSKTVKDARTEVSIRKLLGPRRRKVNNWFGTLLIDTCKHSNKDADAFLDRNASKLAPGKPQ